jgi:hypothetical protein
MRTFFLLQLRTAGTNGRPFRSETFLEPKREPGCGRWILGIEEKRHRAQPTFRSNLHWQSVDTELLNNDCRTTFSFRAIQRCEAVR